MGLLHHITIDITCSVACPGRRLDRNDISHSGHHMDFVHSGATGTGNSASLLRNISAKSLTERQAQQHRVKALTHKRCIAIIDNEILFYYSESLNQK
jgi:hypothetical protein